MNDPAERPPTTLGEGDPASGAGPTPSEEPGSTPFVSAVSPSKVPPSSEGAPEGGARVRESEEPAAADPPGPVLAVKDRFAVPELAPDPPVRWPSVRTPIALLTLLILLAGVAYPGAITLVADVAAPVSASYLSTLVGENISNPALFWERPSGIDWTPVWNATLNGGNGTGAGSEGPWGPTCPYSPADQCSALMNQTLHYVHEYGLDNTTVPLDLVSQSDSGLDPAIYPDAALVQVPRVVRVTHLPFSEVWALVNATITQPIAGFVGPAYVNVISLDAELLGLPSLAGTTPGGTGVGN